MFAKKQRQAYRSLCFLRHGRTFTDLHVFSLEHADAPMSIPQYTRNEIEAGRKLFAADWQFVAAAGIAASLPPMRGVEIAFAGRSNVGKSSLINALTGRKALARTSRTPGRTQELIFFHGGGTLRIVDMPGYGYAAASKTKIAAWTELIHAYLRGRANLARVYVLVDARHGLKDTDDAMLDALSQAAVSHQIVLTKTDEIKAVRAWRAASPRWKPRSPSARRRSPTCWRRPRRKAKGFPNCARPSPGCSTNGPERKTRPAEDSPAAHFLLAATFSAAPCGTPP